MFLWVPVSLSGQPLVEAHGLTFDSSIQVLQKYVPFHLAFAAHTVPSDLRFDLHFRSDLPWRQVLRHFLDQADMEFKIIERNAIILPKEKYWYRGYIYDAQSGESLPGAHLSIQTSSQGTIANDEGYYQILLPKGTRVVQVSYLGYKVENLRLEVEDHRHQDVFLKPSVDLPVVTVTDSLREDLVYSPVGSGYSVPDSRLSQFPSLSYAMDITRYLQLIPGVSTGGDGFGGLHLRGGGSDHNLVLLDGIPIYNSLHMLGATSIFNGDAIQKVDLSKNYFSPKHSGRLSSVLNVRMRDGNRDSIVVNAGLSVLEAHGVLEMPILSGSGTMMLAAQRSHIGDFVRRYSKKQKSYADINGFFQPQYHDYYAKALLDISKEDKLIFNFYLGSDEFIDIDELQFGMGAESTINQFRDEYLWGNLAAGIRWLHSSRAKLFFKTNVYFSRYGYQSINRYVEAVNIQNGSSVVDSELTEFRSSVREWGLDHEINFLAKKNHYLVAGLGARMFDYIPGIIAYDGGQDINTLPFERERNLPTLPDSYFDELQFSNWQVQGFLRDHFTINHKWSLDFGFHTRLFVNDGITYFSFEPRSSLRFQQGQNYFDFSFSHVQQSQHLISVHDNGLPSELWVPSSGLIAPQKMNLIDLTAEIRLAKHLRWKPSCYVRRMQNLTSFVDDPNFLNTGRLNNVDASAWEEELIVGQGNAWGVENQLQIDGKKYFLNINYTYAKSTRVFDEKYQGFKFPYAFERPHEFSVLTSWKPYEKIDLSLAWQWGSGVALPLSAGHYDIYDQQDFFEETLTVPSNQLELLIMPAYHRLDLSMAYNLKKKKSDHSIKLSLINTFDASNISFAAVEYFEDGNTIRFVNGLPFIPSLAYHITFRS